jgi:hypothetical protein
VIIDFFPFCFCSKVTFCSKNLSLKERKFEKYNKAEVVASEGQESNLKQQT